MTIRIRGKASQCCCLLLSCSVKLRARFFPNADNLYYVTYVYQDVTYLHQGKIFLIVFRHFSLMYISLILLHIRHIDVRVLKCDLSALGKNLSHSFPAPSRGQHQLALPLVVMYSLWYYAIKRIQSLSEDKSLQAESPQDFLRVQDLKLS